ncbi:MAG: DUF4924 family protein [Salinivirgaceae bacterium]|nr:DUF4924 family protein [Salinivirgaceae bacterium]
MFVAYQKKKENICEYFLYMFQIEDLIRACKCDKRLIESQLLPKYPSDMTTQNEVRQWYSGLTDQIVDERIQQSGHLVSLTNKINEVLDFHLYLLNNPKEVAYQMRFAKVQPIISELRQRQPLASEFSDLHLALNAVYGFTILRLKGSQVSKETAAAISQLVVWFNELSEKFRAYESGELKLDL